MNGALILKNRLISVAGEAQHSTQAAMRLNIGRRELYGGLVFSLGFGDGAGLSQDLPKI